MERIKDFHSSLPGGYLKQEHQEFHSFHPDFIRYIFLHGGVGAKEITEIPIYLINFSKTGGRIGEEMYVLVDGLREQSLLDPKYMYMVCHSGAIQRITRTGTFANNTQDPIYYASRTFAMMTASEFDIANEEDRLGVNLWQKMKTYLTKNYRVPGHTCTIVVYLRDHFIHPINKSGQADTRKLVFKNRDRKLEAVVAIVKAVGVFT